MPVYIGEIIVGVALLFGVFWLWDQLTHSKLGRLLQALIITTTYIGWIGLLIFGLYNVFSTASTAWIEGNVGGALFILAYGTPCMLVMLAFPIGVLNFYLKALNHKLDINLKYVPFLHDPGRGSA